MPRDHIREFYESGGYIKPRNRKAEALSRVRDGYAGGGKAIQKAARLFQDYADPAAKLIGDWTWRPLQDVAKDLKITGPSNFSPEVQNYGDFMRKMAARASGEGLSPEDLMKSYAITRSSMGRSAINPGKLIDAGLDVPPGEMIRPEGAMAYWLRSPAGRQYLEEAAHTGQVDPKISQGLTSLMTPFGKQNEYPDILNWGAQNLPGREGRTSELVARASQDASSPGEWLDLMANTRGIKPAKQGFWSSLMGRGDMPTFDARQIILNTGLPSAEGAARTAHPAKAAEAVQRLRSRMEGLDYQGPEWMRPFYPHLAHHETWDRSAGEATTHQDLIDTMLARATGGRVGYDVGGAIRKGVKAAKEIPKLYSGSLFEKWANETGRSVDELVEGLRSKNKDVKKYGDTTTMRGVSDRMDPSLFAGTKVDMEMPLQRPRSIVNPQDLQGGYVVGGMSDLSSAGPTIRAINDIGMRKPIWMPGGSDFPVYNPDLWAGDPGALRGLTNALTDAGWKPGKAEGYFANQLMLPQAVDQTHMSMEAAMSMLQGAGLSKKDAASFDDAVRRYKISVNPTKADPRRTVEAMPDFPGINSANIDEYLADTPMARRSALLKVMDKKAMHDIGVPQAAAIRAAQTDPTLVGAPQGTTGRTIGRLFSDPIISDPSVPHDSYTANLGGEFMGGFGKKVPGQLLFKDWIEGKGFDRNNMSSNDMRSMIVSPAVQKIDQRFLDWFMPKYEKLPDWQEGGSVGYADGGAVTPAIGVEGIKGLIGLIKKASGIKQARRFEDAADVTNLKPYNEQALLDTFSRPTSMYGALKPSEFERYAYPLDPNYAQITPKVPGERPWYAAEGSKPDLGIKSYEEYLAYLRDVAQGGGFDKVPELSIGYRGRGETPIVTTHDGRHRLRALRGLDDSPSLVEFKPDATSYRGVTVPSLSRVMSRGQVIPQNNVSKFDTVDLPDELFAFGGSV